MNGGLIRRTGLVAAALSLTLLFGAGVFLNTGSSAKASDSETAALIGYFNQYRASHAVAALATSGSANADAQAGADDSVQKCGYTYGLYGHNVVWGIQGYETAAQIWANYAGDPTLDFIGDPQYHSIGIGRAISQSCDLGYIWVVILDVSGGPAPTPPPTSPPTLPPTPSPTPSPSPSPTPTHSPTPTTSSTSTPTPTPTHTPANTTVPTATPTPTPTPTPSVSPTATTSALTPGDVDCGRTINMDDVLLILKVIAHVPAFVPCLALAGVDCTGGIDAADALVLLEFIEGMPYHLPDGCPPLGSPLPSPTLGPSTTPTPTPSVTPVPAGINHCELAMVAYQVDTAESMNGKESCAPVPGTAYDCTFSTADHQAACTATPSGFPDYTCSFLSAGLADCLPTTGAPKYLCFDDGAHTVECLPTQAGYASYDCAVNGSDVTCTSDAPAPDFVCHREGAVFSCQALASPIPTTPAG